MGVVSYIYIGVCELYMYECVCVVCVCLSECVYVCVSVYNNQLYYVYVHIYTLYMNTLTHSGERHTLLTVWG